MKTRTFSIPLVAILLAALAATAQAGDFGYVTNHGTLTITDYTGSGRTVAIPATIGGRPVTEVGNAAFYNKSSVTNITIPGSVLSIGDRAFAWCTMLTTVTLGGGVTSIGNEAFYNCTKLVAMTIPTSVMNIGTQTFFHCTSLSAITVNPLNPAFASVDGVLFDKSQSTLIQCPAGKAGIVTVPSTVTNVVHQAFLRCDNLSAIVVDPINFFYSSADGVLLNKNQTALLQCPGGKAGSYTVRNSGSSIGDAAFFFCTGLTTITIPDRVTTLGEWAFRQCSFLTNVIIGSDVTTIGVDAFAYCEKLTSIVIPDRVTSIGDGAFGSCDGLTYLTLGSSVANIGEGAFAGCGRLKTVTVDPLNLFFSTLENVLFNKSQTALLLYPARKAGSSYSVPGSVVRIGNGAFSLGQQLASITLPGSVTNIGN